MPHVKFELLSGRDERMKAELAARITQFFVDVLGSVPSNVTVVLSDVKPSDWFIAGAPQAASAKPIGA
ncbi:4-oxalocrotonate tautomerase family protein (plasmid) [Rhizobium sp. YTUHZ045]|uniref:tautomerase family protein n=1 Tax=Rhizobium sp. YTUHZ045 TaxID=2962888 RepID=UPI003DA86CDE